MREAETHSCKWVCLLQKWLKSKRDWETKEQELKESRNNRVVLENL